MNRVIFGFISLFITMSPLWAMDEADNAFNKRGKSVEYIDKAKKMYLNIVKSNLDISVRTKALDRFARLSVFEGEIGRHLLKSKTDPSEIFDKCVDATEYLSPKKLKNLQVPEYIYWRATCLGLWAQHANKLRVAPKLGELLKLIKIGQAQFKEFDGYGFNRIEAGVYIRSKALMVLNLYKPKYSLELLLESVKNGVDVYMTYILLAETYIALEQPQNAKDVLQFAISKLERRLEDNDIPALIVIESRIFLERMRDMYDNKFL